MMKSLKSAMVCSRGRISCWPSSPMYVKNTPPSAVPQVISIHHSYEAVRLPVSLKQLPVLLLQLLTVIRHGDLGLIDDSRVIQNIPGTGVAPCKPVLVRLP